MPCFMEFLLCCAKKINGKWIFFWAKVDRKAFGGILQLNWKKNQCLPTLHGVFKIKTESRWKLHIPASQPFKKESPKIRFLSHNYDPAIILQFNLLLITLFAVKVHSSQINIPGISAFSTFSHWIHYLDRMYGECGWSLCEWMAKSCNLNRISKWRINVCKV